MSVSAALILVAATAWLASPPGSFTPSAEDSAASETLCALECEGIAVRDEQIVRRPEGEYIVLAADSGRVAAGSALLASSDGSEGLAQAVRDAARDDPSIAVAAAREAATAASVDDASGAFKLRALYSPDSGADYELVTAPHSAVWTSAADGLEHLGPDALEEITAAGARELIASAPSPIEDAAGKLVLSDDWRFVTVLRVQDAPAVGEDVRLEFDGFSVRAVTEYAGQSENGERAVVFVSDELPPGAIELRRSAARIVAGD